MVIHLDDILIFSKDLQAHQSIVRKVLQRLHQYGLYTKALKCQFHQSSIEFLGMMVSHKGLEMCQGPDYLRMASSKDHKGSSSFSRICQFLPPFYFGLFKNYGSSYVVNMKRSMV